MQPPGSPRGVLEEALSHRASWGSAPHERNRREGDHPIPFRTRQLSPPSPKVLQRQAAGGQGVALMQGASVFQWDLRALFLFLGTFCGMSSCGLLQVSVHSSVFEFPKEAPLLSGSFALLHASHCLF